MAADSSRSDMVHVLHVVPGHAGHVGLAAVESGAQVRRVGRGTKEWRVSLPASSLLIHGLEDIVPERPGHQSMELLTGVETIRSKEGVVDARSLVRRCSWFEEKFEVCKSWLNDNSKIILFISTKLNI